MTIEPLESRIAPAGIVTITQTANDLKFLGDAEANAFALEIDGVSAGFFRVEVSSGTMLRFGDQTATSFNIPLGTKKNLLIDLGAGADDLSLTNIQLAGKVDIKGGTGDNTINLSGIMEEEGIFAYTGGDDADTITGDVTSFSAASAKFDLKGGSNFMDYTEDACDSVVAGTFTVLGGSGNDSVEMRGRSATMGSFVSNLGAGENSYIVEMKDVLVSSVTATSGSGRDDFSMTAQNNLTIGKTLTVNAGDGPANVEIGAGGTLTVRGKSSFTFSKTTPSPTETAGVKLGGRDVRLGPMTMFSGAEWFAEVYASVSGYVDGMGVDEQTAARSVRMGATTIQGATDVTMNADAITVRGNIGVTSTDAADVSIAAAYIDVSGNVTATLGAGDGSVVLAGDSIDIGGKLALAYGDGVHTTELGAAGGSLSAGSISLLNRTETVDNDETITINGSVAVLGAFSLTDGVGDAVVQFTGGSLEVGGAMTFVLSAGSDEVDLSGSSFTAKSFSADLGPGANRLGFSWGEVKVLTATIKGGVGNENVTVGAESGLIGLLNVDLGAGANNASIESSGGLRMTKLTHKSLSEQSAALDRLIVEGVVVKDLNASLGAADSVLNLTGSRIAKLVANLGAGADIMRMDDNLVTGAVTVNTGFGNDSVRIERDSDQSGESIFLDRVIFTMSDGDDEALVAGPGDETKARFRGVFGFYGDAGTDTFTPHPTNAIFASAPILTGTP